MKKAILLAIVFILSVTCAFARGKRDPVELDNPVSVLDEIVYLTDKNFKKNEEQITFLAEHLSPIEKEIVFEKIKLEPKEYLLKNLVYGWGEGSFALKDNGFGTLFYLSDSLAFLSVTVSLTAEVLSLGAFGLEPLFPDLNTEWIIPCIAGGGFLFMVSRIMSAVRATTFVEQRNFDYRKALGLNTDVEIAFAPFIDPFTDRYGFGAKVIF